MSRRKVHKELPVYIVEDHCDALRHIYRNIGSGHLPLEGNLLVHLDSHPDLLVDKQLPCQVVYDPQQLLPALSIENWILPGCYSGQFSRVVWVKPHWSTQIPDGHHRVTIGDFEERIRLGTDLYYFMSDGVLVDKRILNNKKYFELIVAEWPSKIDRSEDVETLIKFVADCQQYILDVDLDFFSTRNPFLEMFGTGSLYDHLKPLFSLKYDLSRPLEYLKNIVLAEKHASHLKLLKKIFLHLDAHRSLEDFDEVIPEAMMPQLLKIIKIVSNYYKADELDWMMLFNAGETCDEVPLPHHVSTENQLVTHLKDFDDFLNRLPHAPTIVTIARSSDDDYCPKHQVEAIQESVISSLRNRFGAVNILQDYQTQNIEDSSSSVNA